MTGQSHAGSAGNCLLVMPRDFHTISRTFRRTLEEMGYAVTEANEDYPENFLGKVMSKLDLPLARWWTRRVINQRFLTGRHWTLVVIVKGRGIGPELATDFRRHADRVVGYHFDSLAYDRATERWGAAVDRVTTFDYRDAATKGWPLVELFATRPTPDPLPPIRYRFSAILRNHSQRLAFVDSVLSVLGDEVAFVYFFEKNVFSLAINFLRNPRAYWKWRRHIHFKPLDYARYIEVLGGSDFTLDYAHPCQSGATMRSFEALAMGVKLITNNRFAATSSPYFGPHNSLVWDPATSPAMLRAQVAALSGSRPVPYQRAPLEFMAQVIGDPRATGPG